MRDMTTDMSPITTGVEIYLQEDGTWAFFFGNTTICATPYKDVVTGEIKLKPARGDSVRHGAWLDLDADEVAEYCKRLEKLAQEEFAVVEGGK